MDKQEIIEGNILIADFMGRKFKPYKGNASYDIEFDTYKECQEWIEASHLEKEYEPELGWNIGTGKYHSSWNWLMPVAQKIKNLPVVRGFALIQADKWNQIVGGLINVNMDIIWTESVEFIKWYNSVNQ